MHSRGLLGAAALAIACAGILGPAFAVLNRPPATWLPEVALDHTRPRPQGGWYRCAVGEPRTMNPFTGDAAALRQMVLRYTHDALLELDPDDCSLRPALAVAMPELELDEHGRPSYELALREGLRFSDGRPVTLDDVEFTIRAAQSPDLPLGEVAGALRDVAFERTGERSFRIRLPAYQFGGLVDCGTRFRVVQRTWFEQRIAAAAHARGIPPPRPGTPEFTACLGDVDTPGPGTGPYRFQPGERAWRRGASLTLTQNPHCWRRDAYPDCWNLAGIQLTFAPASLGAILAESIDYYATVDDLDLLLEQHPRLRERYRLHEYQKLRAALLHVVWSCTRPPFDVPEVRRALTMLFDRRTILDKLFFGHGEVAGSWFPPGSSQRAPELDPLPFDPAAARSLLARAGVAGLEVEVLCPTEVDLFRRVLELAVGAFRDAGIVLRPRPEPWTLVQQHLADDDFVGGAILIFNHSAVADPRAVFHSSAGGHYADPALDELLERAPAEPDDALRAAAFHEIDRVLHREQPWTLLVYPSVRLLLHRKFRGVEVGRLGLYPEKWWVER